MQARRCNRVAISRIRPHAPQRSCRVLHCRFSRVRIATRTPSDEAARPMPRRCAARDTAIRAGHATHSDAPRHAHGRISDAHRPHSANAATRSPLAAGIRSCAVWPKRVTRARAYLCGARRRRIATTATQVRSVRAAAAFRADRRRCGRGRTRRRGMARGVARGSRARKGDTGGGAPACAAPKFRRARRGRNFGGLWRHSDGFRRSATWGSRVAGVAAKRTGVNVLATNGRLKRYGGDQAASLRTIATTGAGLAGLAASCLALAAALR